MSTERDEQGWRMSRVRQKNTAPELIVRKLLHLLGLRFRLHPKNLPGTPDIVLARHDTIIFVHGCFWHRHPNCRYATSPKTRQEYWEPKFKANIARDSRKEAQLQELGWRVMVIWECETKNTELLKDRLRLAFGTHPPDCPHMP